MGGEWDPEEEESGMVVVGASEGGSEGSGGGVTAGRVVGLVVGRVAVTIGRYQSG